MSIQSEINRKIREAQRKFEQQVNREVDRVNRVNKRAVDDYNRKAEAHNRRVVNDHNRRAEAHQAQQCCWQLRIYHLSQDGRYGCYFPCCTCPLVTIQIITDAYLTG